MAIHSPVLVVEDDEACASRLVRLLAHAGVPATAVDVAVDGAQARGLLERRRYELALVDMYLPDTTGTEVIREMALLQPGLQAVIASSFGGDDLVLDAVRAGAVGYLMKDADDAEIAWSLSCIERGGAAISPGIARRLLRLAATLPVPAPAPQPRAPAGEPASDLTPRERDVLELIAEGCTNKDVANRLTLSVHTIDFYAKRLYAKLSARSRTQAVKRARASGLLG
jgi:DNA-binding NarL/FixJ family response regulator